MPSIQRARRAFMGLPVAAVALTCSLSAHAQVQNGVLVHGAIANDSWYYALTVLDPQIPFRLNVVDVPPSYALPTWGSVVQQAMISNASILVGHSLGGMASRHATSAVPAVGVITLGTGHSGVPAATAVGELMIMGGTMVLAAAEVIIAFAYYLYDMFIGAGQEIAETIAQFVDATAWTVIGLGVTTGLEYLATYPPNISVDAAPGSSYLGSLPGPGANSFGLAITMSPGFSGGPIALRPDFTQEQADQMGYQIHGWGEWLLYLATAAVIYLDPEAEDYDIGVSAMLSAFYLGYVFTDMPYRWCGVVSHGNPFYGCLENDGFVPVDNQAFGSTEQIVGPAHTKETTDSDVIENLRVKLCSISQQC